MDQGFCVLVVVSLVAWTSHTTYGASDHHGLEEQLLQELLDGMNPKARPNRDSRELFNVTIDISIFGIDLHEIEQSLTLEMYMRMEWTDFRLTWSLTEYPGISYVSLEEEDVWYPKIFVEEAKKIKVTPINTEVESDGTVSMYRLMQLTTACDIDIGLYPFDSQTCQVHMVQVGNDLAVLQIGQISTERLSGDPIWKQKYITVSVNRKVEELTGVAFEYYHLAVDVSRKGSYFWLSTIVPVHLLDILSLAGLWIPVSSGEKVGYHVNILLTTFVFFVLVLDNIPQSSEQVALMTIYCSIIILRVIINLIISVIATYLEMKQYSGAPASFVVKVLRLENDPSFRISTDKSQGTEESKGPDTITTMNLDGDSNNNLSAQWIAVSLRLDRIAFGCGSVSSFVILIVLACLST